MNVSILVSELHASDVGLCTLNEAGGKLSVARTPNGFMVLMKETHPRHHLMPLWRLNVQ